MFFGRLEIDEIRFQRTRVGDLKRRQECNKKYKHEEHQVLIFLNVVLLIFMKIKNLIISIGFI